MEASCLTLSLQLGFYLLLGVIICPFPLNAGNFMIGYVTETSYYSLIYSFSDNGIVLRCRLILHGIFELEYLLVGHQGIPHHK